MSDLVENKNRILSTFEDIYSSIKNKNPSAVDDVNTYATQIASITKEQTLNLIELGTFSINSKSSTYNCFTLNSIGEDFFTIVDNKNVCTKNGFFLFVLCPAAISPVNKTVSNLSVQINNAAIYTCNNSINVWNVWGYAYKKELAVGDEIVLYSYKTSTSGSISSTVYLANSAKLYYMSDK